MGKKRQIVDGYIVDSSGVRYDLFIDSNSINVNRRLIESVYKVDPQYGGWGAVDVGCALASVISSYTNNTYYFEEKDNGIRGYRLF